MLINKNNILHSLASWLIVLTLIKYIGGMMFGPAISLLAAILIIVVLAQASWLVDNSPKKAILTGVFGLFQVFLIGQIIGYFEVKRDIDAKKKIEKEEKNEKPTPP